MTDDARLYEMVKTDMETLFQVSQVLRRSPHIRDTLVEVLHLLHEMDGFTNGMISLLDAATGDLILRIAHKEGVASPASVSYRAGAGGGG